MFPYYPGAWGGYGYGYNGFYGGYFYGSRGHGGLRLTDSSPPQSIIEPLTLDQVMSYMKLPMRIPPDPGEAAELQSYISAARGQAEIMQGRDLVQKQWDLIFDYWPSWYIDLRPSLASVDLFTVTDWYGTVKTLIEGTDFIVDAATNPGRIMPPYNTPWYNYTPRPSSSILIRFTSGFTPADPWWMTDGVMVRTGMLMLINNWFTQKLPFAQGIDPAKEYPFGLTQLLSQGQVILVG
jgi:hypothetical protein